jgi:hypothetical protein
MKKAKTRKPQRSAPPTSIRLHESTYQVLLDDIKRDGLPSMNAAIERRLNRTLIDDKMISIVKATATATASEYSRMIADHIHVLMKDMVEELERLQTQAVTDRRIADMQQARMKDLQLAMQKLGEKING